MKAWSRDPVRADNFAMAAELVEQLPLIEEVGAPLGCGAAEIVALGRDGIKRFMSLLPMESVVASLHRSALLAERTWQVNDHNDVVYLAAVAACCGAVIGEGHWTTKLKERRCPTRAGFVGSSPEDLRTLMRGLP